MTEAQRKTFDSALQLADEAPPPVRCLNLVGLGIPYFEMDMLLNVSGSAPIWLSYADEDPGKGARGRVAVELRWRAGKLTAYPGGT